MTRTRVRNANGDGIDFDPPHDGGERSDRDSAETASSVLELLGDEYAREILRAVADRSRTAGEAAEVASVSEPTAYRHLHRLENAGLVTSQFVLDPNGHHYKRYSAAFEEAVLRFDGGEFSVDVEPSSCAVSESSRRKSVRIASR
ncbi:helix-turn-helix domain-containing protein [Natronorubrum sp. JWXQ-INN-674]|uniref:Helix-turn-helix domain-containing protein n=1 Tax=Natronorubrum halalkaliphilum TaxID=2691917 RepID=A0A6B0VQL3_9EURY|nr:winged helix-turn-helix domain-containing protein [Natronorubrum halalkaliphilum]MXV63940.1 helix-turn-helix domain-containing protein [Natronorubrum halalkaliphilum]